ncbi:MAG: ABC transporter ATP-binding protein [Methylobacterium sp.]|nr:ABC transporter ATP-binding protein [Methylobacterium sp.]MCA3606930.1 ABC transporter ATP-binding protein [Methylobacterium sp.]MCA3610452.1 ABC transporter ATP-binding protein [Methylobacterium sp.]MCA3617265.1 ABC transporter ATP-binding protein [Methylobacterium sp.]MCA3619527.1 ABC transporter ATP-binding protein [Methylobacterium sp.]
MTSLLTVENLAVAFRQGGQENLAVRSVSFTLQKGETLALVGESGSGKSVTALSVLGLLNYPAAHHPSGRILFSEEGKPTRDLINAGDAALRSVRGNAISMIFQEPMTSLNPLHSIEQQIGEILSIHRGLSGEAARARVLDLLNKVGIREPEKRLGAYPHQLSGGQRQRVMIAMALANEPALLIADEPTTALDVTVQAQILALLKDLQRQTGMAMLFITHDLGIVRRLAHRVAVMKKGEIVEQGKVADVFANPQHAYTKALLAAEPKGEPPVPHPDAPVVAEVTDVKVHFPIRTGFFRKITGHVKAVDGVSLRIRKGETLGVVGESGSGKTTLGLAILRMIRSQGRIAVLGRDVQGLGFAEMRPMRKAMQIVFQDPYGSLSPRMSVADIVAEGLYIQEPGLKEAAARERVAHALIDVGLDPAAMDRYPHEFSGGQRQRIAIARAMALDPEFVVLDEPTSALDMSVQAQIVDLLRDLQAKRGLAYLFISHDLKVVRALASHVLVMRNGVIVEEGTARDLFAAPKDEYTRALFHAAFQIDHPA